MTSFSCHATLLDGRQVEIRPATDTDGPTITAFFHALSPQARYWRFFSAQPRLSRRLLDQLVAPPAGRVALVAVPAGRDGPVIAFGSVVHVPAEQSCEFSLTIADDWQGVRLGTLLVLVLLRDAFARGHRRFHAEVLSANLRMTGLLRDLGVPFRTRVEAGVSRVDLEIPMPPADTR